MIGIGQVLSVADANEGERIKVRLFPADRYKSDSNIEYAFPLLPKMLHVKPKIGEAVLVITLDDNQDSQRFYIGPIISQSQFMYKDDFTAGATTLLRGAVKGASRALFLEPLTHGAYSEDSDISIYGRKNGDIIISDNDIRIRCGARLMDTVLTEKMEDRHSSIAFNKKNPSFVKLKYYPQGLKVANATLNNQTSKAIYSAANIVGEEINLISTDGTPNFNVTDSKESISDTDMTKIINTAHCLPYGDVLVDFLTMFIKVFKAHTHKYHNLPPCPDPVSENFDTKYPLNALSDKLLSKHIRIN